MLVDFEITKNYQVNFTMSMDALAEVDEIDVKSIRQYLALNPHKKGLYLFDTENKSIHTYEELPTLKANNDEAERCKIRDCWTRSSN